MRNRVRREQHLRVMDLCPCGRTRSKGPLLVEEPRRAPRARLKLRFSSKVQARVRADRLELTNRLWSTLIEYLSVGSRKEFRIFRVTSSWLGPVVEDQN
jgi:hypothetical protein